ncbi:MAG TPA: ATP-dependent DNA helicase RecQ [Gemmatimonadales bacterium]|nr:ATP-dependent DNA helicase RecQ [Gemmatimonadales bacterium]
MTSFAPTAPATDPDLAPARAVLQRHFGYPDLRPTQRRVVRSVLRGRDTLAILPTGGGKSLCFQIPALVLPGFTIVVSPLIALMQDQVAALARRGIPAAALNSTLKAEGQDAVLDAVAAGEMKLLYTSPERLERLTGELDRRRLRPSLLAVDEAHCITEWGHDFRPGFRRLARLRWRLGAPPVVALTGSATPEVRADIAAALKLGAWSRPRGFDLHLGSFDRPNLWFGAVRVASRAERWAALLALLKRGDRMALVYAPTRNATEGLSRALVRAGLRAAPYHAGLTKTERAEALDRFLGDEVEVVVATSAFGMGIDKPDVRLVVHWTIPPTLESYYQEAGRAGRDGEFARCVLLIGADDARLHRAQLEVTFPPQALVERVWREPPPWRGVAANTLASIERLRRELHPERGGVDWRPVLQRRHRTLQRIAAMEQYATGHGCRRARLLEYFGETLRTCAGCDSCRTTAAPVRLEPAARRRFQALQRWQRGLGRGAIELLEVGAIIGLAKDPPNSAAALADVPGVGPVVAERYGVPILDALGTVPVVDSADPSSDPAAHALLQWRADLAELAGVPAYVIVTDRVLSRIVELRPQSRGELARIEGVGPKTLIKHGEAILGVLAGAAASA